MSKTQDEILDQTTIDTTVNEFPGDPALQQVYLARKRASAAAKAEELSLFEYVQKKYPGRTVQKTE